MHDISYWGMIPALSSDKSARDKFTSLTTLVAGAGSALANILIPLFTTGDKTIGGSANIAFGRVALFIAIFAPLWMSFTIFGVRENRDDMAKPAPKISLKKIVSTITGNDQLRWITVIFLIQQIGSNVISSIGSTYIYFTFGYNGGLYSIFTTVGLSAIAIMLVLYPMLSAKFKRKTMMNALIVVGGIGYLLMLVAGLFLPLDFKFWPLTIGYMLSNLGMNGIYLIMMISIMNTVEYNEYLHGNRDEGIITSIRPFMTKLGSAIVTGLVSLTYIVFGITKFTNQISDLETAASLGEITETSKLAQISDIIAQVPGSSTTGVLLFMVLLPTLTLILSYFLYKKHYTLDEDKYEEICRELETRKETGD